MDEYKFGGSQFSFGNADEENDVLENQTTAENKPRRRSTECLFRTDRHLYRRAFSETQLLDVLPDEFKDGESYHCITGGDVDALSYLKVILRKQKLDYCLFSTWCMAAEDVLAFGEWLENGTIKKVDAYVGEIFPKTYRHEYNSLKQIMEKHDGRLVVFRNHSKVFAGYGEKFYFGFEGSANINTNPRTENGCITIGRDIYEFYRQFYDGIKSFEKNGR